MKQIARFTNLCNTARMTADLLQNRDVQLANGAVVPFADAALYYGLLLGRDVCNDSEWDILFLLRRAAFGEELNADQVDELRDIGFVDAGGELKPYLGQVVLASVRGEEKALRVESPFTTHLDRAMFEYRHAREVIRTHADDRQQVEQFLRQDPAEDILKKWRRGLDKQGPSDGTPPL